MSILDGKFWRVEQDVNRAKRLLQCVSRKQKKAVEFHWKRRFIVSNKVRLGVIGVGNMGTAHADTVVGGKVKRCEITALCDVNPARMQKYADNIKRFTDSRALLRSGAVDAVLIATPHYSHTTIGVEALDQGVHVLVEKPISVHKRDCEQLVAAHKRNKKVIFAAMFNQRTDPKYKKIKQLLAAGELGKLTRMSWIVTDWFRTEAYYASGDWRATWAGEGGGVLLNQCPHNLDMLQWLCGMPTKVRAFCAIGKYHNIEVEDDVTAYLEFPGGFTGVFVATTGEAPGTNRLELVGDNGKLLMEGGKITFQRNEIPVAKFSKTDKGLFSKPASWHCEIPAPGNAGQHAEITQNFVNAILDGGALIAPAEEGLNSVELGNAMMLSSMSDKTVELPMNGLAYEKLLKKLVKNSKFRKKTVAATADDMTKSWK
jgi:predicted dehydrogenase